MKTGTLILAVGVAAAVAFGAFTLMKPPAAGGGVATGQTVVEPPRTDAPMDNLTRFFAKKQYDMADGQQRRRLTYYWFEPEGRPYPLGLKFPLVVVLHGAPGKAYAAEYLISRQMQLDYPAFIVVPQSPAGKKWAMPEKFTGQEFGAQQAAKYQYRPELESLPDTVELISRLAKEHPVDTSRIYVTGCSDGGTGAYGAALRYPEVFAAAAAISGAWSFADAHKLTKIPLWILHGSEDNVFPVAIARGMAGIAKRQGAPVYYTELPGVGHSCDSSALYGKPLWSWLFSQKKKD